MQNTPSIRSLVNHAQADTVTPRIALFSRTLGGDGAARVIVNLSRGFVESGLKVDIVLSAAKGLNLWDLPPEIQIVDLKAPRVSASLLGLIRYLRQEQPSVLISDSHYASEVALIAKLFSRVQTRVVVTEHNTFSKAIQYGESGTRKYLIPFFVRHLYPLADGIVTVSHGVARDLSCMAHLPQERIKVIYNPVLTPGLQEKTTDPIDHPWFASKEPPIILGVGRISPQKDFPNLIRAFHKVRQVKPARLMILGLGQEISRLETLVRQLDLENDVVMPGYVKNPLAYMAKAAVFALSSAWEGLPTVLIEAMAVGTPVVSTDCQSGPAEILDNGKYGSLVPVGDSDALANAILSVLAGNSKKVDPTWLDRFTLKSVTQHYLDFLGISSM